MISPSLPSFVYTFRKFNEFILGGNIYTRNVFRELMDGILTYRRTWNLILLMSIVVLLKQKELLSNLDFRWINRTPALSRSIKRTSWNNEIVLGCLLSKRISEFFVWMTFNEIFYVFQQFVLLEGLSITS